MFCANCGKELSPGVRFCDECGTPVPVKEQGSVASTTESGKNQIQTATIQAPVSPVPDNRIPAARVSAQKPSGSSGKGARRLPMILIAGCTLFLVIFGFATMEIASFGALILIAAFVPAILLLFFIYRQDSVEPEPIGLLVKLFFFGVLSTIPAMIIELVLDGLLDVVGLSGALIGVAVDAFVFTALVEEACKYFFLKKGTWKNPAFNYRFDGVVYSATVAIGFEVAENILYMIDSSAGTALLRAAFPGHCVFGIYMGYYYGLARALFLKEDKKGSKAKLKLAILVPVLLHGFYDFCAFAENGFLAIVLIAMMVVLNVVTYKNLKKYADEDASLSEETQDNG